ncbi:MAG: thiamine pyrophosphate-binding protein [Lachnospiraceae bacterium]|nr:thiamine pyrophosphate-binding protein [Lachnospiraceae bacterium]
MDKYYTSETHTQILIALMKFHKVRKIVVSPGTTNICFVGSVQSDPYFELYSSVDERSAAFIALGLAAESGEPVALSCTGSTASRNYVPGLTEAFYRHLPVLAITASQHPGRVGNYYSQVIDRSQQMKDMVKYSIQVDCVHTPEDEWACEASVNKALIELHKNGGGPVHINLVTTYSRDFTVKELPKVRGVEYVGSLADMPVMEPNKRIAILVGVHQRWSAELSGLVDKFCKKYDAVVLKNHASNYQGDYGVNHALIINMASYMSPYSNADLVILIGSVPRYPSGMRSSVMWRVSPDGETRDPEQKLTKVFQMEEVDFFRYYVEAEVKAGAVSDTDIADTENGYARLWQKEYEEVIARVPELPFSNVWIAKNTIDRFPEGSVFHLAGSNTARSWNFFKLSKTIECYSNDGTMGIDGQLSALIGESLAAPDRLHFGVVGDLTFFYDMNSLGNRHIGNNLRLMIINNGKGAEFRIYSHPACAFGDDAENFMAAAGHYGNKSSRLIQHYAEDLGYEYLTASTKEEFLEKVQRFTMPELADKSMVFEVFTNSADESDAIYAMNHMVQNKSGIAKDIAKGMIKTVAGEKGIAAVKSLLKK